ncbi:MAG TPA: hypothetical protein VF132_08855, partial [Rudaea sp.]
TSAGVFTASGGTAVNCGTSTQPGQNPPTITTSTTALSYTLQSGAQAPAFTWSATNATSCTAGQTNPSVFNNLSITGAYATSGTALSQNLCNGSSCGGTVTLTPTQNAQAPTSNTLFLTCTAPDASQRSTSVTLSLAPPSVGEPTCGSSDDTPSDLTGFTRSCSGGVSYSFGAPDYQGPLSDLSQVIGTWPGNPVYLGQTAIIGLGKNNYISFAFKPTTSNALKFSANASWGAGGWISISEAPGQFKSTNSLVKCQLASGSSNNLIFATNGYTGAPIGCRNLTVGKTYYLNIVNANSLGTALCRAASCPMAYTPLIVN